MNATWRPYWVGAGIGVLSWVAFAVMNQPIGISTTVSAASGACLTPLLGAEAVASNAYWKKTPLKLDYPTVFVLGTFLGALASVIWGRAFRWQVVPPVWRSRFGGRAWVRLAAAFLGGVVVLYGARLAGGCTSGHGISGTLQLALSSWVFFLSLFASGVATALALFGRTGK
ncbi:MAG: YeeE/YedE family protein [Verrucomicrobiales bacterium]|nr:YeeE/YedE family protein [Verrucomicrobiales bacterium]